MELDHEFTVPVSGDEAWSALLDLERVAPCIPGATLDSVEGEEFTGRLKVKVGAMTITYRGSGRIAVADPAERTVTIEGSAKEARGSGTAAATVQARLFEADGATKVTVHTKLNVTGRPAQFGRNLLSEVGAKLIARFAANLAEELTGPTQEPPAEEPETKEAAETAAAREVEETETMAERATEPAAPVVRPEPEPVTPLRRHDEAIDLLELAGPSVAKRLAPVAAALVVAILAVRYLLRRRPKGRRR